MALQEVKMPLFGLLEKAGGYGLAWTAAQVVAGVTAEAKHLEQCLFRETLRRFAWTLSSVGVASPTGHRDRLVFCRDVTLRMSDTLLSTMAILSADLARVCDSAKAQRHILTTSSHLHSFLGPDWRTTEATTPEHVSALETLHLLDSVIASTNVVGSIHVEYVFQYYH